MKTHEQRLAKAAELEEHYFKLWERHYKNSINAWDRFQRAKKRAERIVKRVNDEIIAAQRFS